MRESGFDVSFRFGPYGADTHRFAPVGLNSLLYKTEKDLEQISTLLGHTDDAREWSNKAARAARKNYQIFLGPAPRHVFRLQFRDRPPIDV